MRPSAGSAGGVKKGAWSAGEERRLYLAAVALNAPTASKIVAKYSNISSLN